LNTFIKCFLDEKSLKEIITDESKNEDLSSKESQKFNEYLQATDHEENNQENKHTSEERNIKADLYSQKKEFILNQMQKLLGELTLQSSNKLNDLFLLRSNHGYQNRSSLQLANSVTNEKLTNGNLSSNQPIINQSNKNPFSSDIILCSSCQGDLFVV
jgi:hypothetical protein